MAFSMQVWTDTYWSLSKKRLVLKAFVHFHQETLAITPFHLGCHDAPFGSSGCAPGKPTVAAHLTKTRVPRPKVKMQAGFQDKPGPLALRPWPRPPDN